MKPTAKRKIWDGNGDLADGSPGFGHTFYMMTVVYTNYDTQHPYVLSHSPAFHTQERVRNGRFEPFSLIPSTGWIGFPAPLH